MYVCSETGCASGYTDAAQQAECLQHLDVKTLMSVFPWQAWLNEHFYWIPLPDETSTAIAIVDGINNVILTQLVCDLTLWVWQMGVHWVLYGPPIIPKVLF